MVFCDDHAEVYATPNDILTEHFIIIISMGCDFNLKIKNFTYCRFIQIVRDLL